MVTTNLERMKVSKLQDQKVENEYVERLKDSLDDVVLAFSDMSIGSLQKKANIVLQVESVRWSYRNELEFALKKIIVILFTRKPKTHRVIRCKCVVPGSGLSDEQKVTRHVAKWIHKSYDKSYRTIFLNAALALSGLLPLDLRVHECAALYKHKRYLSNDYLLPRQELEMREIRAESREVQLLWLKAHIGAAENKRADSLAKTAALRSNTPPDCDIVSLSYVKKRIRDKSVLK
ncbi:hypothetical protein EVAR_35995_1 [Eumeta japonica]|uniref:RNase H type-1 domain-containing protein n=1 Tax=Eumeta variegata TaxID=151549 RepID=A0A4C1WST5_EUMVA|nr:hypothetical protein EVAR_35995_1 [Eumeta japonica]